MKQKLFVKLEKKLAYDLKPGELFIVDLPDPDYFVRQLSGPDPIVGVFMRTNVPSEDCDDMGITVYKIHITITDPEDPAPPRVNPHAPPGLN